jgi:tetratricopeptide (TPR) repeat protein
LAAVLACALGMGCKPVMVTAPLIVLLYDRCFVAGSFKEALRQRWGLYLALAATWILLGRSVMLAFSPQPSSAGFQLQVTPFQYARSQPGVILHYLALAFWPASLCLDYAWPAANSFGEIAPAAAAIGALLAATLWALVKKPKWGFIGAWFFLVLAPTSSILPIQDLAFEHRMYLSLAALMLAAVAAVWLIAGELASRRSAPAVTVFLTLCAAAGLSAMTFQRNAQYGSEISIWQDTADKRPGNLRAWNVLGEAYLGAARYDDAVQACTRAIELNPKSPSPWYNRGLAWSAMGRAPEAMSDFDQAIRGYTQLLALSPDAAVYNARGRALVSADRPAEAIRDFDRALDLNPGYAEAHYNRGIACANANRFSDAIRDYGRAIALRPDYAAAYDNRAVAYYELKAYDKACADVKRFMELGGKPNPGFLAALAQAGAPAK